MMRKGGEGQSIKKSRWKPGKERKGKKKYTLLKQGFYEKKGHSHKERWEPEMRGAPMGAGQQGPGIEGEQKTWGLYKGAARHQPSGWPGGKVTVLDTQSKTKGRTWIAATHGGGGSVGSWVGGGL